MTSGKVSRRGKLTLATALTLAIAAPVLIALVNAAPSQGPMKKGVPARRSFETASIKASAADARSFSISGTQRLEAKNASLRDLIRVAYHVRDFQISGGPAWIDSEHYDIDAKVDGNPSAKEWFQTMGPMLQSLLEDRFKLKLRRETKELPVYVLTVAKSGPKFIPSKERSCTTFHWVRNSPPPGQSTSIHCGVIELTNIQLNRTLDAVGMRIRGASDIEPGLMTFLSRELDRIVIDKTGLTGLFDFRLEWNRAATAALVSSGALNDPNKATPSPDPDSPSIFTALEEQLGLKLESSKGPVEVLIIDHAEKPSRN
jgi:uncharacterized protein (TIGR03435 family)